MLNQRLETCEVLYVIRQRSLLSLLLAAMPNKQRSVRRNCGNPTCEWGVRKQAARRIMQCECGHNVNCHVGRIFSARHQGLSDGIVGHAVADHHSPAGLPAGWKSDGMIAPQAIKIVRSRHQIHMSEFLNSGADIVVGDEEEVQRALASIVQQSLASEKGASYH